MVNLIDPPSMSSSVESSQSQIEQMSPCFHIQEFRCRSQGRDESFEDFLPAIELMSICTQLSKQRSVFGTEKRRVRLTLVPAFGLDGSSPPHVTSWGYQPVVFPSSNENATERRRVDKAKMNQRDEWRLGEHSQPRWGYSSPAFHCRSPPPQLYKFKNSLNKLEQNSAEPSAVPGMTIQQAILFQRTFNKFLTNDESRKHNNTPKCSSAAETLQVPLTKHVSMPNFKFIQTRHGGKERQGSKQFLFRKTCRDVDTREKPHKEMVTSLENNMTLAKCPLYISESQDLKKDFIRVKKIDIKLPCLDKNQEA